MSWSNSQENNYLEKKHNKQCGKPTGSLPEIPNAGWVVLSPCKHPLPVFLEADRRYVLLYAVVVSQWVWVIRVEIIHTNVLIPWSSRWLCIFNIFYNELEDQLVLVSRLINSATADSKVQSMFLNWFLLYIVHTTTIHMCLWYTLTKLHSINLFWSWLYMHVLSHKKQSPVNI